MFNILSNLKKYKEGVKIKKTLPLDTNPVIKTYPSVGNYLGILNGCGYDTMGILFKHYLDYYYAKGFVTFLELDYIRLKKFKRIPFTYSDDNFIQQVQKNLEDGRYLLLILNEHFVEDSRIHTSVVHYHDWLIYGYDNEANTFLLHGYYGSEKYPRIYGSIEVSCEDVKRGVFYALNERHMYKDKRINMDNHIFWPKENIEEKITKKAMRKSLKRYISKFAIIFYRYKFFVITGENAMSQYRKYIHKIQELYDNPNNKEIDVRPFSFCLEHKKIIQMALKQYSNNPEAAENYGKQVVDHFDKILKLLTKFKVHQDVKIIGQVVKHMDEAQEHEIKILSDFLTET